MSVTLTRALRDAWLSGLYVGGARPVTKVSVRRGYMQRERASDGHWTAVWTPTEDYVELPGVLGVGLDWSYDQLGMQSATIDLANVYMRELAGALGSFHRIEQGWFSPFRAYLAPKRTARIDPVTHRRVAANEWEQKLSVAAEVMVEQGYGALTTRTFTGLLDTVNGTAPSTMRLTARDFGQLLTDQHLFGWNIDPKLRDPVTFVDRDYVRARERSKDPAKRREARMHRKHSVIITDLRDMVVTVLRWAGFPKSCLRVAKAGVSLNQPVNFARGEFLADVIKKAQDVTGYSFWIGPPSADFPMGRPTWRRSNAMYVPEPTAEVRDDQLLTGLDWQRTDEPLAGIIRVRGKDNNDVGQTLGGDTLKRVMATYRPPWHRHERDARMIRHVIHTEELYGSERQCAVAARMIAVQEALGATTANVEIPAHPGLELDDVLGLTSATTGLNTRVLVARLQSQFTRSRQSTTWKQTLGVALLDTPDVVETVQDLHDALFGSYSDESSAEGAAAFGSFGYPGWGAHA